MYVHEIRSILMAWDEIVMTQRGVVYIICATWLLMSDGIRITSNLTGTFDELSVVVVLKSLYRYNFHPLLS